MIPTKSHDVTYTIYADHVTSVYFTDWSVNCKKMKDFNAEQYRSCFRFSNMILFHKKKLQTINMIEIIRRF